MLKQCVTRYTKAYIRRNIFSIYNLLYMVSAYTVYIILNRRIESFFLIKRTNNFFFKHIFVHVVSHFFLSAQMPVHMAIMPDKFGHLRLTAGKCKSVNFYSCRRDIVCLFICPLTVIESPYVAW